MEGESMSEWKEVRLGDVCNIFGRIGFRGYTINDLVSSKDEGAISLSPTNIIDGEINVDKCSYISWNKYYESPEIMIFKNDILIVKTGSSYGRTALVKEVKHQMTINPQFVVLKNININPIYLSYYIKSKTFQNQISSIVVGSAIPTLSQKNLANLYLKIQGSQTQQEIAGILSSLDAKIETNNKLNEKLEEMAQAIFKSWFVDFEPFKDMPFHETELGMIPEGWEVGIFDDIVDIVGGGTPSKSIAEYYTDNGIAWITPKDLSLNNNKFTSKGTIDITELGYEKSSAKLMPKGSVLFSSRAPIGYITIAKNEICTNQGFKSAVPKKAGTAFVYYLLKNKTIEIENMATGSTFKEASGTLMKNLKIIIPLDKVLDDFEKIIMPIFEFQMSVEEQNDRLASLRDTLLPRLMSGELKV